MKVVFLDVDGVLCLDGRTLPPEPLEQLKRIVEETGARIVLSSTWRLYTDSKSFLLQRMRQVGCPLWIDQTPRGGGKNMWDVPRHEEIGAWLKVHYVERFAVVDDCDDAAMPGRPESFFQCATTKGGLTKDIADCVIAWLGGLKEAHG